MSNIYVDKYRQRYLERIGPLICYDVLDERISREEGDEQFRYFYTDEMQTLFVQTTQKHNPWCIPHDAFQRCVEAFKAEHNEYRKQPTKRKETSSWSLY